MKTKIKRITAALTLTSALINITGELRQSNANIMTGKLLGVAELVIVCAIIVFGICYLLKSD